MISYHWLAVCMWPRKLVVRNVIVSGNLGSSMLFVFMQTGLAPEQKADSANLRYDAVSVFCSIAVLLVNACRFFKTKDLVRSFNDELVE